MRLKGLNPKSYEGSIPDTISTTLLARALGVTRQVVQNWKYKHSIPAWAVKDMENIKEKSVLSINKRKSTPTA